MGLGEAEEVKQPLRRLDDYFPALVVYIIICMGWRKTFRILPRDISFSLVMEV